MLIIDEILQAETAFWQVGLAWLIVFLWKLYGVVRSSSAHDGPLIGRALLASTACQCQADAKRRPSPFLPIPGPKPKGMGMGLFTSSSESSFGLGLGSFFKRQLPNLLRKNKPSPDSERSRGVNFQVSS